MHPTSGTHQNVGNIGVNIPNINSGDLGDVILVDNDPSESITDTRGSR